MKVLFEDSQIIVVIKPQGVLSQSDANGRESMVELLTASVGSPVYPVHRLDRTTLGLMVFAKTPSAAAELSRQIASGQMTKKYIAAVHGTATPPAGDMTDLLYFDRRKNKSFVVRRERAGVKKAVLHYETLTASSDFSVLEITLETGRTHQIRVQCASRGMPLWGDHRYGAKDDFPEIALCAHTLSFRHPQTAEDLTFQMNGTDEFEEFRRRFSVMKE